jgi:hypothetical protein
MAPIGPRWISTTSRPLLSQAARSRKPRSFSVGPTAVDDVARKCKGAGAEAEGSIMKGYDADGIAKTEADHSWNAQAAGGGSTCAICAR